MKILFVYIFQGYTLIHKAEGGPKYIILCKHDYLCLWTSTHPGTMVKTLKLI